MPRWRVLAVFILPALVLYTIFIVYPLVSAFRFSFSEWKGTLEVGFAGLGNYRDLLTIYPYDEQLWRAFGHNAVFFVGTMLIQNTVGLLFAVLLFRYTRGKRTLQAAFTTPYLVDPLVVGYLWSLLLSPTFGPVNAALEAAGLESWALPWLGDTRTALPIIILVNAWQWVGFPMLLFSAALAGIPAEYHEAARVDGASSWQAFRRVTLPLLTPAIGVVSVLTFIGNFNAFGLVYAMAGSTGSPAGSTDVLGLLFYRVAFREGGLEAIGRSSALAVLMFVFIFGVSMLASSYFRRKERALL
ncbi:carbohydrate ABC transporter permease [Bailinhaonella thermotolerans]|uniref:Sugar ABC transporter permease n=1 Tax=Bailinhaonella thermotolerans TaxID=1070861 RepID=A0A3A4AX69_9ACTN|nr:sugar ABC transporter permease [Bailinhaonella thermotolerans]RJL32897.1 sugar ABC transporter permease [Bailinhaonella thermotolerans]